MTQHHDAAFWDAIDSLVASSEIVIDRPRGSAHPKYPNNIYPVDYGYLADTTAMDGGGIDVWVGSDEKTVVGVICTVDCLKKDAEIKILLGCTEEEIGAIYEKHNDSPYMKGILIRR